jgi:hypothetical protein
MEPRGFGPIQTLITSHSRTATHPIKKATRTKLVHPGPRPCREPHATIPPMNSQRSAHAGLRRAMSLVIGLVLVGCSPAQPTPSPSGSVAPSPTGSLAPVASPTPLSSEALTAIYLKINGEVQAIRGLDEKEPVIPAVVSPAELAAHLNKVVDRDTPPELLASFDRLYKAMGLLPADANLGDVYVDLLESQVAGTYDPKEKKLYVVSKSGTVGPFERSIYAHEYEHALQDQHFDLSSRDAAIKDNSDKGMAWQSVFEGDAYTLGAFWTIQELNPFELADLLGQGQDPEAMAALERIPPIVVTQILFAAIQGVAWTGQVYAQGGWPAVDAVFADPPTSTEQILHPDKWADREPPIDVDLPDDLPSRLGAGWTKGLEDTMGEQQFSVWVTGKVDVAASLSPSPPPESVAGWGGDRLMLLDGPGDAWAVVFKTEWDTAADAAEFETAIGPRLDEAAGPASVLPGEGGAVRWIVIGSDDATLGAVAGALGLAG